jgi:hypothetical protein
VLQNEQYYREAVGRTLSKLDRVVTILIMVTVVYVLAVAIITVTAQSSCLQETFRRRALRDPSFQDCNGMVRRLLRSGTHHRETRAFRSRLHRPSPYWVSDGRLRRERNAGVDFATSFWHNQEGWQNITRRHPMKIHTIGIDLGKTSFHLVGLNERGEVVVRRCSTSPRTGRFI